MDYVVGSVAALISGNVTPNRPKLVRKALTPMKHQPSPNVTPKSQQVEDRSIFLSPSVQKKKAIVKKSPKRIFQNPDLDETNEEDGSSLTSPKAEKVKKHLKDDLESSDMIGKSPKSLKNKRGSDEIFSSSKKVKLQVEPEPPNIEIKESKSPKKQKQKTASESSEVNNQDVNSITQNEKPNKSKKQRMQKAQVETPVSDDVEMAVVANESNNNGPSKKKNKKRKKKGKKTVKPELDQETKLNGDDKIENNNEIKSAGETNKNKKKKGKKATKLEVDQDTKNDDKVMEQNEDETEDYDEIVNPNAITNEDTDSEHESDDEIDSEDEVNNKEVLESAQAESSDEENEEEEEQKEPEKKIEQKNHVESNENDAEVVKRTLFVGNVPFSAKCKKEIKKIFSKYGQIETIRIRTVPVKDARVTPKMAVIKNELHPDRTTVNVYVKFSSEVSVAEALAENNTVLNDHHLRVTRSDSTGSQHDPKCSVFIGNIPFGLEDEGLRAKFEQCGEIETVRIVRDKKTNAGKGFGYVNFASKDGVELALGLTEEDLTIKNRILRVKRVTQTPGKQKGQGSNQRFNRGGTNQGRNHTDSERKPFDRNNRDNTQDRKQFSNNKSQGRSQGLRARGDFQGRSQGGNVQGRNQGGNFQGRSQGGNFQGRNQAGNFQGRSQGGNFQGRNQGGNFQGKTQGGNFQRRNQDDSQGSSNYQGKNQQDIYLGQDGAHRRILKRKTQDNEGPPNKVQKESTSEPEKREKKPKKEFVGMTAEKKKKHKFDKGQKKKKVLSEILAKK